MSILTDTGLHRNPLASVPSIGKIPWRPYAPTLLINIWSHNTNCYPREIARNFFKQLMKILIRGCLLQCLWGHFAIRTVVSATYKRWKFKRLLFSHRWQAIDSTNSHYWGWKHMKRQGIFLRRHRTSSTNLRKTNYVTIINTTNIFICVHNNKKICIVHLIAFRNREKWP